MGARVIKPQPPTAVGSSWLSGLHAVLETLRSRSGEARELWLSEDRRRARSPETGEMLRLARKTGVTVRFKTRQEIERLPGGGRQGAVLLVARTPSGDLEPFLGSLDEERRRALLLVALDQIEDPHNLGAVARAAANLGADGLLLCSHRASPVGPGAVRASAGAIQKIPVFTAANLASSIRRLKEKHGFWILGADQGGAPLWSAPISRPLLLVIGSEESGIRPLVKSLCDGLLSIPQAEGGVESLNASCAAAIVLYELARRKSLEGVHGKESGR